MTKEEIFAKLQTEVTIRGLSPGTYYTYKVTLGTVLFDNRLLHLNVPRLIPVSLPVCQTIKGINTPPLHSLACRAMTRPAFLHSLLTVQHSEECLSNRTDVAGL